jgi:hydroxymethylpyrimidine/phosphomethylpyrimidine kinase
VRRLICSNEDVWKQYVQHDFVKQLGQGTLSRERFIHFLKCVTVLRSSPDDLLTQRGDTLSPRRQDYLYLKYYARANGYGL